jgi:hypothetical protein
MSSPQIPRGEIPLIQPHSPASPTSIEGKYSCAFSSSGSGSLEQNEKQLLRYNTSPYENPSVGVDELSALDSTYADLFHDEVTNQTTGLESHQTSNYTSQTNEKEVPQIICFDFSPIILDGNL